MRRLSFILPLCAVFLSCLLPGGPAGAQPIPGLEKDFTPAEAQWIQATQRQFKIAYGRRLDYHLTQAQMAQPLTAIFGFTLHADGRITDCVMHRGTGQALIDTRILTACGEVPRMKPAPAGTQFKWVKLDFGTKLGVPG